MSWIRNSEIRKRHVNFTGDGRLVAVLLDDGRLKLYGVN